MNNIIEILAPVSNVNDTSVVVCEFFVEDKSFVKNGQDLLAIETSKTTENIKASKDGYIGFLAKLGDEVPNGEALAIIADTAKDLLAYEKPKQIVKKVDYKDASDDTFGQYDVAITLGEIMFADCSQVNEGDILCKVRIGQKVENVLAPKSGYVHWRYAPYSTVTKGKGLGVINDSDKMYIFPSDDIDMVNTGRTYQSVRVSRSATRLLMERGLSVADLGQSGLITVDDTDNTQAPVASTKKAEVVHSGSGDYQTISMTKRSEAKYLSEANREVVLSQATVLVPTKGIFTAGLDNPELASRFSSIIILETARLLRQYRSMMSVYEDGKLYVYDDINIGYALSIDDGLKVPVIKNADTMDLDDIIGKKNELIEKYVTGSFSSEDLTGGTFTITDLSSTGSYMFNPVVNLGQSVILGIGGENSAHTEYPLILAYDHRVIDGATASEFLCSLRDRLIAHEEVLLKAYVGEEEPYCESCFRTVNEVENMGHFMIKSVGRHGNERCLCSLCLGGW